MTQVTILLPVYNGAATLRQAIRSALVQEFDAFEVLIINDASRDGSREVADSFAGDERVRIVHHERNCGLAATLNEGVAVSRGKYVARLDQDDEALPARLRTQVRFLEQHRDVAAVGSFVFHMGADAGLDRLVRLPATPAEVRRSLPRGNCLYHPAVMFRREVVIEVGGYREAFKNAEDYDLWLRLNRRAELANVPEPLLRYRFSPEGMTLGRKWEQLYYVYLAQEANRSPDLPLTEMQRRARHRLLATDRPGFLEHVARHTASEMIQLGHRDAVMQLLQHFARELSPEKLVEIQRRLDRT